ncbi:hypothetical protein C8Q74DRAFT_1364003 [Neofusicoccum parvum]|uniref:Uncharacterized protein n=1 Tax=Neofusicoccum parvum TaxID=310453 RepID=A0ACB5SMF9_9PEZI|nr:hypothetical protein C8Q74DRAFT_1364003 [Neofusicoccum parvum]
MVHFGSLTMGLLTVAAFASAVPTPSGTADQPGLEGIPVGSPDGIYIGSVKEDGRTQWEFLGDYNSTSTIDSRSTGDGHALAKRNGVSCNGFGVNADDANTAQGKLADMCGNGYYFSSKSIAQVSGGAVAFGCNYGNGQTCHKNDLWDFFGQINSVCGFTHGSSAGAGWYSRNDWKATYGRTSTGSGFC